MSPKITEERLRYPPDVKSDRVFHYCEIKLRSVIRGTIELRPAMGSFRAARLHVMLEEISVADTSARILAVYRLWPLSYDGKKPVAIPFELVATISTADRMLNVRAHLACHGGDEVRAGDWVTMRSCPPSLSNSLAVGEVRIELQPV